MIRDVNIANGGVDYLPADGQTESWLDEMERAKEAAVNGTVQLQARALGPRLLVEDLVND